MTTARYFIDGTLNVTLVKFVTNGGQIVNYTFPSNAQNDIANCPGPMNTALTVFYNAAIGSLKFDCRMPTADLSSICTTLPV